MLPPTHKSWSIYKFPFEEKFLSMEKFSSQGKNLICQTWRKVANYLDCDEIKVFDKEQKPKAQKKDILNDLHKCSFCSFWLYKPMISFNLSSAMRFIFKELTIQIHSLMCSCKINIKLCIFYWEVYIPFYWIQDWEPLF